MSTGIRFRHVPSPQIALRFGPLPEGEVRALECSLFLRPLSLWERDRVRAHGSSSTANFHRCHLAIPL